MKPLNFKKWHYILGASLILTIICLGVYQYLIQAAAPKEPQIELNYEDEYVGDILTVNGKITADCPCTIAGTINKEDLQLDENGNFSVDLDVSEEDTFIFRIEATATGNSLDKSSKKNEIEAEAKRKQVKVYGSENPTKWDSDNIELKFKGEPDTKILLKSVLKRTIFGSGNKENEIIDTKEFELDEEGFASINTSFNTTYNTEHMYYPVEAYKEGYSPYKATIKVQNLKYDTEKVDEDRKAYEIEEKFNSMEKPTGDDVVILVNKDIQTSRTVGYRYVLDPANDHFIIIRAAVTNLSDDIHHANPNYFTIQDSNGQTYNPDQATYTYDTYFDAINIQPYAHASGVLVFIVPKKEKELTLIYDSYDELVYKKIYIR